MTTRKRKTVELPSLYYGTHSTCDRPRRNADKIKNRELHIREEYKKSNCICQRISKWNLH